VVEAWNGDRAVVMTTQAAARGERFVMQLTSSAGEPASYAVCVVSSTPDADTGRFRLDVTVGPVPAGWQDHPVPQF
jgi:hypothetical protein